MKPPNGSSPAPTQAELDPLVLAQRVAELEARVQELERTLQDTVLGLTRILAEDLMHA